MACRSRLASQISTAMKLVKERLTYAPIMVGGVGGQWSQSGGRDQEHVRGERSRKGNN